MDHRWRTTLASAAIVGIFFLIQVGTLVLIEPFQREGHQVVEDTGDPTISIVYLVAILVVTGLMLLALKYGGASLLRLLIIFAGAYIALFVFDVLVPDLVTVTVADVPVNVLAVSGAFALALALYLHPEWYVIDTAGIVMGIGAAGLFGINFGVLPAIVLLVVLAVYDAISVYGTKHMLTLASGAMEMRVPVVLVIPVSLSYSFLEEGGPDADGQTDGGVPAEEDDVSADAAEADAELGATAEGQNPDATAEEAELDATEQGVEPDEPTPDGSSTLDAAALEALGPAGIADLDDEELSGLDAETLEAVDGEVESALRERLSSRDALFIGLGDAVIPTVLVASAAFFVDAGPELSFGVASASLPAVTAMAGTLVGLVILLWMVLKGRAHAGLPLLNGGAIAGYLLGALASGLTIAQALGVDGLL